MSAQTHTPLALVGNSLAVQVAATERARRGQPTLVINPGGPWGGYFGGFRADGTLWDSGMVVCEFTSFRIPAIPPLLDTYDPMRRNDVGRFAQLVRGYMDAQLATRKIKPIQMWMGDRTLPDLLLGNAVNALPQLAGARAICTELRSALPIALASSWHAMRKDEWRIGDVADYDTVSRLNHGNILHEEVIAPFARKVLGCDASHLDALFHRIPWLPLYWPQTLLAVLEGRPVELPETVYSYPVRAPVASLCANLSDEMTRSGTTSIKYERILGVERSPHGFLLQLEKSGLIHASRLAWASSPGRALQACGVDPGAQIETRIPLMLTFLRIEPDALCRDFSVLHAVAGDTGVYRVNNVTDCAGGSGGGSVQLVVEANPHVFESHHGPLAGEGEIVRAVIDDLQRLGIVHGGHMPRFAKVIHVQGALALPTKASLRAWTQARSALIEKLPGIELLAGSAGPSATSFSDQIVQGLQLAARSDVQPLPRALFAA